ncbi:MAG TPA: hypothetical protein VEV85_27920, partial [Bryobacteraceae bacterium]|nr:hypothetical protein [Bryobacteraceae bacterium]
MNVGNQLALIGVQWAEAFFLQQFSEQDDRANGAAQVVSRRGEDLILLSDGPGFGTGVFLLI